MSTTRLPMIHNVAIVYILRIRLHTLFISNFYVILPVIFVAPYVLKYDIIYTPSYRYIFLFSSQYNYHYLFKPKLVI